MNLLVGLGERMTRIEAWSVLFLRLDGPVKVCFVEWRAFHLVEFVFHIHACVFLLMPYICCSSN